MLRILSALILCLAVTGCAAEPSLPLAPIKVPHKPNLREKVAQIEVLDFYTTWCAPCALAAPTIDVLIAQGHKITKINAERETELALKHKITAYPTFVVLKHGKEIYRTHNVQELRRYMNKRAWHRHRPERDEKREVNPNAERPINWQLQSTPGLHN